MLDYTNTFNTLTKSLSSSSAESEAKKLLKDQFDLWQQRIGQQSQSQQDMQTLMKDNNPVVIPRNHLIEAVLQECQESGSPESAEEFLKALRNPYQETELTKKYQSPAADQDQNYQTFCGT